MSDQIKFSLGCSALFIGFIVLIVAGTYGGSVAVVITLLAIVLLFALVATIQYILNAPRRRTERARLEEERRVERARLEAETALKNGRASGLRHFWRIWNIERISKFLKFELSLPERGLRDWLNRTDAPKFREMLLKVFKNIVSVCEHISLPANKFIPKELKDETWIRMTATADCVWDTAQQLFVLAKSGVRANDLSLQESLKKIEKQLQEISTKVNETFITLKNYVAAPHQYETAFRRSLRGLDNVVKQVEHQAIVEKETIGILEELESTKSLGDKLMREAQSQKKKELVPRKTK